MTQNCAYTNESKSGKEQLVEFVHKLTQEEARIILTNFAEIVSSLGVKRPPDRPGTASQDQ